MKLFTIRFITISLTFVIGVLAVWIWFSNYQMNRPIDSGKQKQTKTFSQDIPRFEQIQVAPIPQIETKSQAKKPIPVEKHENFDDVVLALKRLIPFMNKKGEQTFLISNVIYDNGEYAYAYWKQDNSIIILHFPFDGEPDESQLYWLRDKARMDLKNVVPKGKYGNLGCCLIPQDFADKILSWCKKGYKLKVVGEKRNTELN